MDSSLLEGHIRWKPSLHQTPPNLDTTLGLTPKVNASLKWLHLLDEKVDSSLISKIETFIKWTVRTQFLSVSILKGVGCSAFFLNIALILYFTFTFVFLLYDIFQIQLK